MPSCGGNELILKNGGSEILESRRITLPLDRERSAQALWGSQGPGFLLAAGWTYPLPARGCHFATAIPNAYISSAGADSLSRSGWENLP